MNSLEKQKIFKTVFHGFEKEEVLKYIDELSQEATKSENELQNKIDEISKSREQLETQIQGFDEKIRNMEQELNIEKGKSTKLSEMVENLQVEIDRQRKQTEAKERECQSQQEQNRTMKAKLDSLEYKSKKYDDATVAIGTAILEAQQSAKRILDAAAQKSEKISEEADVIIGGILTKIDDMQTDFLSLRGKMNESIEMLNSRFDEIEQEIERSREVVSKAKSEKPVAKDDEEEEILETPAPKELAVSVDADSSKKQEPALGRLKLTEQELQKHRYF